MKHLLRSCSALVLSGLILPLAARGEDAAALQAQLSDVNNTLAELKTHTPDSPQARALREAAKSAWQTYQTARAAHPDIRVIESQVASLLADIEPLRAAQETAASTDAGLQSLRLACETAIAACRTASGEEATSRLEQARQARDAYAAARSAHAGIQALETQIAVKHARIAELRAQEETLVAGDAGLVALKTAWLNALTACREYLPDRAKLAELATTRADLQKQVSALQEVSK